MRPSLRAMLFAALVASIARAVACLVLPAAMLDDRDAYLGIAQNLREGRGFSSPWGGSPSAYRPPLYPLLLAPVSRPEEAPLRAGVHVLLGALASAFTVSLAALAKLSPGRQATAGMLVALDPLLMLYSAYPMTESLAVMLSAGLLATAAAACRSGPGRGRTAYCALAGAMFALAVLCRPTYWAYPAVVGLFGLQQQLRPSRSAPPPIGRVRSPGSLNEWLVGGLTAVVILAPWPLRNLQVFGVPILTTTHGGYTLLLGNNPAYYREVVDQPWGVIWDGSRGPGQQAWAAQIDAAMKQAGVQGELARDQWMRREALTTISGQPGTFLRACIRRAAAFWSIVPHGASRAGWSGLLVFAVGVFYSLWWAALILGAWTALRRGGCAVELAALLASCVWRQRDESLAVAGRQPV